MASIKKRTTKAKEKVTKAKKNGPKKIQKDNAQYEGPLTKRLLENFKIPSFDELYPDGVDDFLTRPDQAAAIDGNAPSMVALVEEAKNSDHDAFMSLIKIHTSIFPLAYQNPDALYIPSLSVNKDFYSQDWVQERLRMGFHDDPNEIFQKDFWDAIFSQVGGTPTKEAVQRSKLKRQIIMNRDKWNKGLASGKLTFGDIWGELYDAGYLGEKYNNENGIDSLRKFLNLYGVKGTRGGGTKRK